MKCLTLFLFCVGAVSSSYMHHYDRNHVAPPLPPHHGPPKCNAGSSSHTHRGCTSHGRHHPRYQLAALPPEDFHDRNMVHVCPLHDLNCMRSFLASNSNCKIRTGVLPDPMYMSRRAIPLSMFYMDILSKDVITEGLYNVKITEFSKSKRSGRVVISILLNPLIQGSTDTIYTFERRGKEDIVINDWMNSTYPLVTLTAIIPTLPDLDLNNAEAQAYIETKDVHFSFGPKVSSNRDPDVMRALRAVRNDILTLAEQDMSIQAPYILNAFIQKSLCDFGNNTYTYYS